jgi:PLAT/LH2 domain-containing protein
MPQERTSYLLLLRNPSAAARRDAVSQLKELGITVVAQFGGVAIEVLATADEATAVAGLGLFSARLKGPMKSENLEKLTREQRQIVGIWNARYGASYRRLKEDDSKLGRAWSAEGLREPMPYTAIGAEDFLAVVARYEERTKRKILPAPPPARSESGRPERPMSADDFRQFEKRLADAYKNPTLAYHLARLARRLGRRYESVLLKLPPDLIAEIIQVFFAEAACWKMTGEMAVGIVFVESSRSGGPKFSNSERNDICNEILAGQSWLTSQHPEGNLSWVYDIQMIKIDVANGTGDPDEDYWRDPAMGLVTYNGLTYSANWSGVGDYREDMRVANRSAHAMVIFVTPYTNWWHAYASSGRITLARKNDWGGWGRNTIDMITAHETSHLFGASDEYTGSGTPCSSCDTLHGCDRIPNGNCGACAGPRQDCVMDGNSRRLCGYTRGHIGWGTLVVETTTADEQWAGTDDDVWIDIGDREFELDTPNHDDRERGNREGYALWSPGLQRSDIKRVLIRKSPDGFAGGWKLKRVRVWHGGDLVCDHDNINRWLENDRRFWVGCITDRTLVSSLTVKITTADVSWAGTDDDVTITLAGRSWDLDNEDHDDFERGDTNTFVLDPGTAFYQSDIHSVRIHKSPDGIAGGWKLKGVQLIVNGTTIYNNQSINKWLEDDDRTWSASI